MRATHDRRTPTMGICRMLMAVLVLAIRLGAALVPMAMGGPAQASTTGLAALLADPVICHADDVGDHASHQTPREVPAGHGHDCGLCPICHFLAAAALPSGSVAIAIPVEVVGIARPAQTPAATGPPRAQRAAARPRAPPAFSA